MEQGAIPTDLETAADLVLPDKPLAAKDDQFLIGGGKCCTLVKTGTNPVQQKLYTCGTCSPDEKTTPFLCLVCALSCHQGHDVQWCFWESSEAYCECRKVTTCTRLDPSSSSETTVRVVVASKSISFSVSEEQHIKEIPTLGKPICLLVDSDNTRLYSCNDEDPIIRVRDLESGERIGMLKGHNGAVTSMVQFGDVLFSGSSDRTIREWNTRSGEKRYVSSKEDGHKDGVTCLALWIRNGSPVLYSGSSDKNILQWDLQERTSKLLGKHDEQVNCLTIINDMMFSGGDDETIQQWDLKTGEFVQLFQDKEYRGSVRCIAGREDQPLHFRLFCAYGDSPKRIVENDKDELGKKCMHVWKVSPEKVKKMGIWKGHEGPIQSILISRLNRNRVFSGSHDKTIHIWDISNGESIQTLKDSNSFILYMFNTNDRLYVASSDKTIRVWTTHIECSHEFEGHQDKVLGITLANDHLYSCSLDGHIRVWNTKNGECKRTLVGHEGVIHCLVVDGGKIFTGSDDATVRVWDLKSGKRIQVLKGHSSGVNALLLMDEQLVSCSSDWTLRVWDATTGRSIHQLVAHKDSVYALACSEDFLFSGSDDMTIAIWDRKTFTHKRFLFGHTSWINGLCVERMDANRGARTILYSASKDRSIRVWDVESGECIQKLLCQASVYCLVVQNLRLYAGFKDGVVSSWCTKTWQCKEAFVGHTDDVRQLQVLDGKVYSCSDDKTIRSWNLQILLAPQPFLKTCFSSALLDKYGSPKELDPLGRNALMLVASYGLIGPLKMMEMDFFAQNECGESPFYFALINSRWNLLKHVFGKEGQGLAGSPTWHIPSTKVLDFLGRKAKNDDYDYFKHFFNAGLDRAFATSDEVDKVSAMRESMFFARALVSSTQVVRSNSITDIVASSFLPLNPKLKLLSLWIQINGNSEEHVNAYGMNRWTLLHYACYAGCPKAARMLLSDQTVNINAQDVQQNQPLHIALHETREEHLVDFLQGQRGLRSPGDVLAGKMDCARLMLAVPEIWRRPELFQPNNKHEPAFHAIILSHYEQQKKLKEKRTRVEQWKTQQDVEIFEKSLELIADCNEYPEVVRYRSRIARRTFFKQVIPYVLWLVLLCIMAISGTTRNNSQGYYFGEAIRQGFLGEEYSDAPAKDFTNMETVEDFWQWFNGPFSEALYSASFNQDELPASAQFYTGHKLIGAVEMRQLRVRNDICFPPSQFGSSISRCLPASFEEDRESFGPPESPKKYFYSSPSGFTTALLGQFNDWYPSGGFKQQFGANQTEVQRLAQELQDDKWIDEQTRVIIIQLTVYNANLNFLSIVRFVSEFPASGRIVPYHAINTLKAFRYESTTDFLILALEVLVIIYFCIEFLYLEIYELVLEGKKYFTKMWNYYEIAITLLFIAMVCLRMATLLLLSEVEFDAPQNVYVETQLIGEVADIEQKITGCLVGLAFLRAIKFLEIPEFSGVTARAIIDTITHRSFIAFVGIFVLVVISFTMTFHLAFGLHISDARDIERTVLLLVRLIFGEITEDFELNDRLFGTLIFLIFMFFTAFILMNMFIAVISDIYVVVHKQHKDFWERHMTHLLILAVVKSERKFTTTGDILGRFFVTVFRTTKLQKLFQWLHSLVFQGKTSKPNLWEWSSSDSDSLGSSDYTSSNDYMSETDDSTAYEMDSMTQTTGDLENGKQEEGTDVLSQSLSMPESIGLRDIRKKGKVLFNESTLDNMVFKFFLKRTEATEDLRSHVHTLQQDVAQIRGLLQDLLQATKQNQVAQQLS